VDFIGTGDAFGSGGRLHTCFQIRAEGHTLLLDCGASSLIGLKRMGFDPARVDIVVVSHFHGDHYGGIPFLLRARQIERPSERVLTVLGPQGTTERLAAA
jgi:ribonuclease BN (tRNA processing enzyme)